MATEKRTQYFVIDVIRILSAVLVMLNHFATFAKGGGITSEYHDKAIFSSLSAFASVGAIGVETFFVISGFVIAMSASGKGRASSPKRFLTMRAIRLLPALWISSLIALVARTLMGEPFAAMASAAIRSSLLSPIGPYIDGVVWSLVVEAVFYLSVAVLVLSRPRLSLEKLALILGTTSVVYILTIVVLNVNGSPSSDRLLSILYRFPSKVFLLRYGVFFAAGMLLWSAKSVGRTRLNSIMLACFLTAGLAEVIVTIDRGLILKLFGAAIWIGSVAAIAAGVLWGEQIQQRFAQHKKVLQSLGGMSYTVYLNHYSIGLIVVGLLFTKMNEIWTFIFSMIFVVTLSYLVLIIERIVQGKVKAHLANRSRV